MREPPSGKVLRTHSRTLHFDDAGRILRAVHVAVNMWGTSIEKNLCGRWENGTDAARAEANRSWHARGGAFRVKNRDGKMKSGADTDFAFDPDAATVGFDQVFGDGQAQAGAARFAGAGGIDAIETFEDTRLIGLRNADARVGNGQDHFITAGVGAQDDLAIRQSVLDGVVQ